MGQTLMFEISTEVGVQEIRVPYAVDRRWLEVLSRSAWAIELLSGVIRHHGRALHQDGERVS
jgi:hypothetical protein